MADVFLLPFLPLAMKGMQLLLTHMPMIASWGEKAAGWLQDLIRNIGGVGFWNAIWVEVGPTITNELAKFLPGIDELKVTGEPGAQRVVPKTEEDFAREDELKRRTERRGTHGQHIMGQGGGPLAGTIRTLVNATISLRNATTAKAGGIPSLGMAESQPIDWRLRDLRESPRQGFQWANADAKVGSPDYLKQIPLPKQQLGGFIHGGPGEGVPTMLHGGEIVIPRSNVQSLKGISSGVLDILAGTDGQLQALEADVNNYWMEAKRDRQDPQSDFMKFKLEVIGEDLPNTLLGVNSFYRNIGDMTRSIAAQTQGFGAGWTAAGLAAFNLYGVGPWDPNKDPDDDAVDPNRINTDGWNPLDKKSDKEKRVDALIAAYTGPPSAKYATPAGLDGGVNIYGPGRTSIFWWPCGNLGWRHIQEIHC